MANKRTCTVLALTFFLVLILQNCEAKREVLKKIFSYLDFDARDVKAPSAIASRSPVVVVPQYKSVDPIYIQPITNPVPLVMMNGITPYSSLPNPYLMLAAQQRVS